MAENDTPKLSDGTSAAVDEWIRKLREEGRNQDADHMQGVVDRSPTMIALGKAFIDGLPENVTRGEVISLLAHIPYAMTGSSAEAVAVMGAAFHQARVSHTFGQLARENPGMSREEILRHMTSNEVPPTFRTQ